MPEERSYAKFGRKGSVRNYAGNADLRRNDAEVKGEARICGTRTFECNNFYRFDASCETKIEGRMLIACHVAFVGKSQNSPRRGCAQFRALK
jgi:hypothetical protein